MTSNCDNLSSSRDTTRSISDGRRSASPTGRYLDVQFGELGGHLRDLVLVDGIGLEGASVLLARCLQLHALDPVLSSRLWLKCINVKLCTTTDTGHLH